MHSNLDRFRRKRSDENLESDPNRQDDTDRMDTTADMDLPANFFSLMSPNDDILNDQFRIMSPGAMGTGPLSPPSMNQPEFSAALSDSMAPFAGGDLPGPVFGDESQAPGDNDAWKASVAAVQARRRGTTWRTSPHQSPSSNSPTTSLEQTTPEDTSQPSSSSMPPPRPPAHGKQPAQDTPTGVDRKSLELIHFFFSNLASGLLFSTEGGGGGSGGSAWRRLILPLTYGSEPLRSAVCAITSAHLESIGAVSSRASVEYHKLALGGLHAQIGRLADVSTSLATTLLLIQYDAIAGKRMASIITHIQAAHHLLSLARDKDDPVIPFLEKAFHLYDVSVALSQGSEPISEAPRWKDIIRSDASPPPATPSSSSSPAAATSSSFPPVDSVFGLALKLFPILHRLASLRSLTEELHVAIASQQNLKIAVLRAEHQSATVSIGTALERWHPLRNNNKPGDTPPGGPSPSGASPENLDVESWSTTPGRALTPQLTICYHHALAYRESALVYLHRAIRGLPASHEHVRESCLASMRHCTAAVNLGSSKVPLWPLFISACNAEGQDRLLVTQTFQIIGMSQHASVVRHLWSVVANVWKKMDSSSSSEPGRPDAFTIWRDVGQSMGLLVFLG